MRVIAVFGGRKPIAEVSLVAAVIGGLVAVRGPEWVVLTGGSDPGADTSVKHQALVVPAARRGRSWIGVPQRDDVTDHCDGSGLVLGATLKHKRNYLEACLCDGAVALPGEEGTISEAVATLCLSKPVIFLGRSWESQLSGLSSAAERRELDASARKAWIDAAMVRLKDGPDAPEIDNLVETKVVTDNLRQAHERLAYLYETDSSSARWAIDTLVDLLKESRSRHSFPNLSPNPNAALKSPYKRFLEES